VEVNGQYQSDILLSQEMADAIKHITGDIFSERELKFTFAICYRPSVCLSSATFVRPTQAVQSFGNISTALGTLAIL